MTDKQKYDVFLSYNSLDHVYVERVAKELKARLEFALKELWKRRDGFQLTHAACEDLGRQAGQKDETAHPEKGGPLSRAIATYAEGVYLKLTPEEQQALPTLFRKLVRAGSRSEEDTRRRIGLQELDVTTQRVARELARQRLLMTTGSFATDVAGDKQAESPEKPLVPVANPADENSVGTTVEVAHEELLRRWGRLKEWVNEDRQFLQWRSRIELKVDEYRRDGDAALLRDRPLQDAKKYYPARASDLEGNQSHFLDLCLKAEKKRRRRFVGMISSALLLLMAIFGVTWNVVSSGRQRSVKGQLVTLVDSLQNKSQPAQGRDWFVNSLGMTMLQIPPGSFVREDPDRENAVAQKVTLTQAYFLSDREITVGQFQQFIDDPNCRPEDKPENFEGPYRAISPTRDHPVQQVNWSDAVMFCNWLSRVEKRVPCYERIVEKPNEWRLVPEGTGYRLPTEAEWEYACRAGSEMDYCSGRDLELLRKYANFAGLEKTATACGEKLPNGWGLFDMHGNVWEWCHDWYGRYGSEDAMNPFGPSEGHYRVLRGGSWNDAAQFAPSAYRLYDEPGNRNYYVGFRCAQSSSDKPPEAKSAVK